jgi:cardiolipin synthase
MAWRHLWFYPVVLLAGCRTGPAQVACFDPDGRVPPRKVVFVRQVAQDTAVNVKQHPVSELKSLVLLPADYGMAISQIALRRRLEIAGRRAQPPIADDRPTLDPDELEKALKRRLHDELQPGWVDLYPTGETAQAALYQVIDSAMCRIDILMYLWDNDPLGWDVAHRLAAVAGPDRPVRILIDGGANMSQGLPKEATAAEVNQVVCWLAERPYVQLIRTRDPNFHFDHRKVVIADGRIAWSGGRNFTYPSFFHDRDVSYTLIGPLVCQLEEIYEKFWRQQGGAPGGALPPAPDLTEANMLARLIETSATERSLSQAVYRAIDFARHHIYMENPYLTDNRILLKLVQARKRGVDVRVMTTVDDDSQTINSSNKVTLNRLRKAGVRVYLYPGMTHAKTTVVDGVWGYLGTGNFDRLSLRHNHELGMAIGYGWVINDLEEQVFLEDFKPEREITERIPVTIKDHIRALIGSLLL